MATPPLATLPLCICVPMNRPLLADEVFVIVDKDTHGKVGWAFCVGAEHPAQVRDRRESSLG